MRESLPVPVPFASAPPPSMRKNDYPITDTIAELKRMGARVRRAERERNEINEIAKKQRAKIRKLRRLLLEAYKLIPNRSFGREGDKLIEVIDAEVYAPEEQQ